MIAAGVKIFIVHINQRNLWAQIKIIMKKLESCNVPIALVSIYQSTSMSTLVNWYNRDELDQLGSTDASRKLNAPQWDKSFVEKFAAN